MVLLWLFLLLVLVIQISLLVVFAINRLRIAAGNKGEKIERNPDQLILIRFVRVSSLLVGGSRDG